jgi:heptosyltransferase III
MEMKFVTANINSILISRTDSIGDVVLTLPICIWIKKKFPNIKLYFLGNSYTLPVLKCLNEIDEVICWDEFNGLNKESQLKQLSELKLDCVIHVFPNKEIAQLMKKAKVSIRIGTSHRFFHLFTCNVRPNFSRKKSDLHEAQLNFELLKPLGLSRVPTLEELSSWMLHSFRCKETELPKEFNNIHDAIILHPKSKGSAIEWPIEKYISIANTLLEKGEKVVFSGTAFEGEHFSKLIPNNVNCYDQTGKLNLEQFIYFISNQKALIACSTGPYHLAGVLGIKAIGIFSSRRPIHPGRWKALGKNAHTVEFDKNCNICRKLKECSCIQNIQVNAIIEKVK